MRIHISSLFLMLAVCARISAQSTVCPGCFYQPPDFVDAHLPGVTMSFTPDPFGSWSGGCVRLNQDAPCVESLTCITTFTLDITITNPAPGQPLPEPVIHVGGAESKIAWGVLTLYYPVATVHSDHGAIQCGKGFQAGFTWLTNWIGTLTLECTKCQND